MKERMAYKFRIYPDGGQARLFRRTAGCCRFVYNLCLEQKTLERHRSEPRSLTAIDQHGMLKELKVHAPFLKEVPHHCLLQSIIDLHKAFKSFFEKRTKYPRPHRKYRHESFRFPDPKQLKFRDGAIFLPKAGWVRMVGHRPIVGTVRNVTVSPSGDHWYVAIQVEREIEDPISVPAEDAIELGGDIGVVNALAMSDGTVHELPRMTEKERKKEENLGRIVSRRKKGSRNRMKAMRALRNFKARIARRRKDAKHKVTTRVVDSCDVLYLEDFRTKNLTASAKGTVEEPGVNVAQKSGANRSILDVSPGETLAQIEYKMRRKGGAVHYVNPAYTSQRCSECGHVEADNRPTRDDFLCVSCGHAACADHNAARNIYELGRRVRTGGLSGLACGSSRAGGRKQEDEDGRRKAKAA